MRHRPVAALLAWAVVLIFMALAIIKLGQVGLMVRPAVFAWSEPVHVRNDISNAFKIGDALVAKASKDAPAGYRQIFTACKLAYDQAVTEHPDQQYEFDYPPLQLLANTLWVWHVQKHYPDLHAWPFRRHGTGGYDAPVVTRDAWQNKLVRITEAQIAGPMLMLNTVAVAIASLGMLGLVWVWMARGERSLQHSQKKAWTWGDWLLLVPVIVLLICQFAQPFVTWQPAIDDLDKLRDLDLLIVSPAFWIFMVLRFVAAISLVRFLPVPIRAPLCGLLAAAAIWLNPAMLLDSHAWPQWDMWILPFFILAALACSVNRWTTAGVLLDIGCLLNNQLLLVAPVLIFCPLLAGWPWRFLRILGGLAVGSALILWPWLMAGRATGYYALGIAAVAAIVMFIIWHFVKPSRKIVLVHCLVMIVGASMWIGGLTRSEKQTWYTVGFQYGSSHNQSLRIDRSMGNLCSIMESRFGWQWDDVVTTLHVPGIQQPQVFNVIDFTRGIYLLALILCTIGAAVHFRRNDVKALAALVAPWVLFPTILPQMAARYTILPVCMAAALLGISTSLSLLQMLLALLCCVMLGHEMLLNNPRFSPLAMRITSAAIPDLGWVMLLVTAMFLYLAIAPSRRPRLME